MKDNAISPIVRNRETIHDPSRRRALIGIVSAAGALSACAVQGQNESIRSATAPAASGGLNRFAVNLESWWRALPLHARIDAAARAGFVRAEMWGLGDNDRAPTLLRTVSRDAGIKIVHCTVNVPNLASASTADTLDAVERSLEQIMALGAQYGTVVGHRNVDGMSKSDMLARYQDRLADVAPLFEAAGVIACIEPFNPFNHPGHFLYGAEDAVSICRSINSPNVKVNWDLFHMQRHEGNVVHYLGDGFDQCGLIQIADSPGRRQPGTGEMNYTYILNEALRLGYSGPFGLECFADEGAEETAIEDIRILGRRLNA